MKKTLNIKRAREMATFWHQGQTRKYTREPYIVHPASVAKLISDNGGSENQIIAAWLHDTLEDTDIGQARILEAFGPEVLRMVVGLTNPSKPTDGNRAVRQEIDRQHLANQRNDVLQLRICDISDNVKSIEKYDPVFAYDTYFPEKRLMLPTLKRVSEFPLFYSMMDIINHRG